MQRRALTLTLAATLAASPAPSEAIAPVLLIMIKQIAQQAATSMIKDALLSSLDGMGCKGMALSNALAALDARGGGAGALLGGMPKLPAIPGMPAMPTLPGMPGMPGIPGMPTLPGGVGMQIGGLTQGMAIPPDMFPMVARSASGSPARPCP